MFGPIGRDATVCLLESSANSQLSSGAYATVLVIWLVGVKNLFNVLRRLVVVGQHGFIMRRIYVPSKSTISCRRARVVIVTSKPCRRLEARASNINATCLRPAPGRSEVRTFLPRM